MRIPSMVCVCSLASGLFAAPLDAAQATLVSSKDNTLFQVDDGALSNGSGQHFFVGLSGGPGGPEILRRGVLAFDVASALPAGAIIESAQLQLHLSMTAGGSQVQSLHRLLADWGEGASDAGGPEGGGADSALGDATWYHTFYDDMFWTNPGGDFTPTISASQTIGGNGYYTWTSSQLAVDVQDMLDIPGSNFGWILIGDETTVQTAKRWDAHEIVNPEFRPMLIISYKVPAPGALALLGLGALAPRRRRRA